MQMLLTRSMPGHGRQLVVDRDAKNADAADPLDAWAWSGQVRLTFRACFDL